MRLIKTLTRYALYTLLCLVYFIFFTGLVIAFIDKQDINTIYFKIGIIWAFACTLWCTYASVYLNEISRK